MRERTTWQVPGRETNRQAATSRKADIYEMNVEHPQPSADQYMAADAGPDTWAETPASYDKSLVKADYDAKGHVKRNEVGFAEFQAPTFDRPAWGDHKYDNHKFASERKAVASHRLASALLRTENKDLVKKVAVGFMALPDASINGALKAMTEASPAAMPEEARFKRAYACTKLAARMLDEAADEPTVERLARAIYQIDDLTLKSIIKAVATSKVAASEASMSKEASEGGSEDGSEKPAAAAAKKSGSKKAPGSEHEKKASPMKEASASEASASEGSGGSGSLSEEAHVSEEKWGEEKSNSMTAEEMLAALMNHSEEEGGDAAPAPAPAPAMMPEGMAAPAPAPAPAGMAMASSPAISFDEDTESMQVHTSALEALFADDPEVKAQREIMAAQRESVARAAGYNVERTASSKGAKKLGAVKASKEAPESALTNLWDRP